MTAVNYTLDDLLKLETIGYHPTYGEMKINNDKEKVYVNGQRIAVESLVSGENGDYWRLSF